MIITFCGHSDFHGTEEHESRILAFFKEMVGEQPVEMYLGGYGGFDSFAYDCCSIWKERHPETTLVWVTPYMSEEYQRKHLAKMQTRYDAILYPGLENKPPRYAISYRNKYMVEQADYVVAYIDHTWGGAYSAYQHAIRKKKKIFNLADFS